VTNKDTFKYPELLVDENGVIDFISTKQWNKLHKSNVGSTSKWKKILPWALGIGAASATGWGIYSAIKGEPKKDKKLSGGYDYSTATDEAEAAVGVESDFSNSNQGNNTQTVNNSKIDLSKYDF
jgi:hypothetical protein